MSLKLKPHEKDAARFFADTKDLYETISKQFNYSRGKNPWKPLVRFCEKLGKHVPKNTHGGILIDVGCGNCRNMLFLKENFGFFQAVGIDFTSNLLIHAKDNIEGSYLGINLVQASMSQLPFRNDSADFISSIAAFNHLPSKSSMKHVLANFNEVLDRKTGFLLLTSWRKWQEKFRKQVISNYLNLRSPPGLVLVPWKRGKHKKPLLREYHLLSKGEITKLVRNFFSILEYQALGGSGGKDNHFIIARLN